MSNERVLFSLLYSVNADAISFIHKKNINKNRIFHFYFFNQDFFLTIISITLLFGDLADNIHLEGNILQLFATKFSRFHKIKSGA